MAGEVALDADAPGLLQRLAAWWPREAAEAVRIALTAIAAIWLAMWLELALPHWAGWTVISVTLATRAASLRKSLWRAGSTLVGVTVAMVLVANFAQATLAFDLALALWMGLLTAASSVESGQRAYGFASMGFTVPIIALADVQNPEAVFQIGVDRCSTILLGIGCAYASNVFVAPGVPAVSRALAGRLEAAAAACDAWMAALRRGGPLPRPRLRPARPHRRGCRRGPERRAPARHRAPAARPAGDGRPGGPPRRPGGLGAARRAQTGRDGDGAGSLARSRRPGDPAAPGGAHRGAGRPRVGSRPRGLAEPRSGSAGVIGVVGLRAVDVLGLYVEPAVICLLAALVITWGLRWILDRIGINHLVWNRALFDFSLLTAVTALLILSLRVQGP
ncbi:FUSC family protein [Methylobacterium oryzae]|uniref:FUSC family protein n=1 Tax=Methylobacterium oryzae TaxID=334852 RepID=UPI002F355D7B